jgi:CheY-like chemotaxis protein
MLCREGATLRATSALLRELGMEFQRCMEREQARTSLRQRKFDPVILDCDVPGAMELLAELRADSASGDSIVVTVAQEGVPLQELFRRGANLIVRKPIVPEEAERTLRTARGLVMRMRRHSLRQPTPELIYVDLEGAEPRCLLLDLSEGGMSVQAEKHLEHRRLLRPRFALPFSETSIEATAEVVWSDSSGRAGLRFLHMPDTAREELRRWMRTHTGALRWIKRSCSGDERARITAPICVSGVVEGAVAMVLDLTAVFASVALFVFMVSLLSGTLPAPGNTPAWATGMAALNGVLYRWVFFAPPRHTPGMTLSAQIIAAYVEFAYRRRLAGFSPVLETS